MVAAAALLAVSVAEGQQSKPQLVDLPCKCAGNNLPKPPVRTTSGRDEGGPKPIKDNTAATTVSRPPQLDPALSLPRTTKAAKKSAGKLGDVLSRLEELPSGCVTLQEVKNAVPALKTKDLWISGGELNLRPDASPRSSNWSTLARPYMYVGVVIIPTPLQDIRAGERDYTEFVKVFRQDYVAVYPVLGSYVYGFDPHGYPFVEIDVYYHNKKSWGCEPVQTSHLLEHCVDGRIVVDYYNNSPDYIWFSGRDTYYPICKESNGGLDGYLIVTEFGFDIRDCPEKGGTVRNGIRDHIQYMLDTARAKQRMREHGS